MFDLNCYIFLDSLIDFLLFLNFFSDYTYISRAWRSRSGSSRFVFLENCLLVRDIYTRVFADSAGISDQVFTKTENIVSLFRSLRLEST